MEFTVIIDEQTPLTPAIEDVSKFTKEHEKEIEAFREYAVFRNDGIGLAANQCALNGERFNLRMCAIKTDTKNEESCRIAIDPKIVRYHGIKLLKHEGCLTWKGVENMTVRAERYYYVDVEFYTPDGEFHQETHKAFQAQVWQHELNHINGIEEEIIINPGDIKYKLTRNDKCPCESGKKLKQCCINDYNAWTK